MPEIEISGVRVKFPFDPYPVQRRYMATVIESLENGRNPILESPTGTGKTLCLLCATLAWVESKRNESNERSLNDTNGNSPTGSSTDLLNMSDRKKFFSTPPKVIYASRTHSQIIQAMTELKRTEYRYFKTGVIASRDQLCMKEELKNQSNADKTHVCNALQTKKPEEQCKHFLNVEGSLLRNDREFRAPILDIEDLDRIGRRLDCCPFYMSKKKIKDADIVFMPYNYLLDPNIRYSTGVSVKNAIVILDEAHNVEKMCKDSAGTQITSTKIDIATRDLDYIIKNPNFLEEEELPITIGIVTDLALAVKNFAIELLNIGIKNTFGGDPHDGGYVFDVLERAGFSSANSDMVIDILYKLSGALSARSKLSQATRERCPDGIGLRALQTFFRIVFSSGSPDLRDEVNKCYKVYIEREPKTETRLQNGQVDISAPQPKAKKLNLWCFSPAFGMQFLYQQKMRCLILTSGTLAPLKPLIAAMKIPDAVSLENGHVIRDLQVCVKMLENGPDQVMLDSSYKNRDDPAYIRSLGQAVVELSKTVPDGLLLFFPSYPLMEICTRMWKAYKIWNAIDEQKKIFMETRTKEEFEAQMKGYYDTINDTATNGAMFMAVLRGKVSEGLDFADMYGRGVIIAGIPLAPCKDPKVRMEMKYLDENRTCENGMLSGNEWYTMDAVRAVNQAIGRVIRHKDDYGGIFFCDRRFNWGQNKKDISKWIQGHLRQLTTADSFGSMIQNVQKFYESAKETLPKPKPKIKPVLEIDETSMNGSIYLNDENETSFNSNNNSNASIDGSVEGMSPAKKMKA